MKATWSKWSKWKPNEGKMKQAKWRQNEESQMKAKWRKPNEGKMKANWKPNEASQEINFISFFFVEGKNEMKLIEITLLCSLLSHVGITYWSRWYHVSPTQNHAVPDLCVPVITSSECTSRPRRSIPEHHKSQQLVQYLRSRCLSNHQTCHSCHHLILNLSTQMKTVHCSFSNLTVGGKNGIFAIQWTYRWR